MDAAEVRARLEALGFGPEDVDVLATHFLACEERGLLGHGVSRIGWLEGRHELNPGGSPKRIVSEAGYERWDSGGAVGYLMLHAVVEAQLANPPARARLVVCDGAFPTGALGYWTRRLAENRLVAVLTATSTLRLAHPEGGPPLTGTNPLSIAIPSSDGKPLVVDASMAKANYGDVLSGRAGPADIVPFGGEQAHKAFALAVGFEMLVASLTIADGPGAVLLVARPESDPVPALRTLAGGVRLPGDSWA